VATGSDCSIALLFQEISFGYAELEVDDRFVKYTQFCSLTRKPTESLPVDQVRFATRLRNKFYP
jgi:hypothetical protein